MELETVFYVVGIIFMTVMLILVAMIVAALLVIRARIVAIHDSIEGKISKVTNVYAVLTAAFKTARHFVARR
jgi:hypothetical protein